MAVRFPTALYVYAQYFMSAHVPTATCATISSTQQDGECWTSIAHVTYVYSFTKLNTVVNVVSCIVSRILAVFLPKWIIKCALLYLIAQATAAATTAAGAGSSSNSSSNLRSDVQASLRHEHSTQDAAVGARCISELQVSCCSSCCCVQLYRPLSLDRLRYVTVTLLQCNDQFNCE